MSALLPVTGMLIAAAITPGPNNLIVMEAGTRRDLAAAGAAMSGVVLGSLALLALVWSGVGVAMRSIPEFGVALSIAGSAYIGWLGASLLMRSRRRGRQTAAQNMRLPSSVLGVAAFQVLNPKAWVLVTTAAAVMTAAAGSFFLLAALMTLVTSLCLTLWAVTGATLSRFLARPHARRWFDRAMGGLLAVSAMGIVTDALA